MKTSQRKLSKIRITIFSIWLIYFSSIVSFAQNWQEVGGGTNNNTVKSLYADSMFLYVGLEWSGADQENAKTWDGSQWFSLPPTDVVRNITKFQNKLIAMGGGYALSLNDSTWDTLGVNVVNAYNHMDNELYFTGTFDSIGGIAASRIAKWNGTNWTAIDTTTWTFGPIYCAIIFNGELYIGGNFFSADGSISRIAKWNGTIWQPLGAGITGWAANVTSFAVYNNELYVAGAFTSPGNCIAKWDGNQWFDVGGGVTGFASIYCLKIFHNELYAAGSFSFAGGVPANSIAKWDGTNWCSLGNGAFDNVITSMEVWHDTLYIGGSFWTIGGDSINKIAQWTGGNYVDTCGHIVSGINEITNQEDFLIYPNPASSTITIESSKYQDLSIKITDILGREVIESTKYEGSGKKNIDINQLPSGLYILQLQSKIGVQSKKFVKE